jgi:thiamine biosynthesis protein ThiS
MQKNKKITVTINGKKIELENISTVQEMLNARKVTGKMFAVERNKTILQKQEYDVKIQDGDIFEIVGFFGGG